MTRIELDVYGMTCVGCSNTIIQYLENQGAENVAVSIHKNHVGFDWVDNKIPDDVLNGIEKLGYKVANEDEPPSLLNWLNLKNLLIISSVLTLPLVANHIFHVAISSFSGLTPLFQFILTLPVFIIGVYYFGVSAFKALRSGHTNMDVLIILGSTAAFFYSLYGLLTGNMNMIFFETTATIITLVLLGNWIEHRSLRITERELDDLSGVIPEFARRLNTRGETEDINLKDLSVGDKILLRTGDRVPVDGRILNGNVVVNESIISGESELLNKTRGSDMFAGAIIQNGSAEMIMSKPQEENYIQNVVKLIRKAQAEKSEIQRLADRISSWFVPLVVSIAVVTFVLEFFFLDFGLTNALINSIAVLVISCPCAMGLATPTALSVGLGRLAKMGILVKGKNSIQKLSKSETIIFDKTGTLTTGVPVVEKIDFTNEQSEELIKSTLLSISNRSSHPVSRAVYHNLIKDTQIANLEFTKFEDRPSKGITAISKSGTHFFFGKDGEQNADAVFHIDGQEVARIYLIETLAPGVDQMLEQLKELNITPIVLSGDRDEKVQKLTQSLGIKKYHSSLLPEEKYKIISDQNVNKPTVMVGDGINDAPALQRASVGISFNDSSALAQANADVILTFDNRKYLAKTMLAARMIMSTIQQNLFWAFIYNIVAIPMAAMGYLSPMIAAMSMAFSDIVVIGNSLLLRKKITVD
jgi:Cu+-exporting ATPase